MKDEDLAAGFRDVDGASDLSAYRACLRLIDRLPYYQRCKPESYRRLKLSPGLSVLDVGCGLGDDVVRMAGLVTPGGRAVGADASERMIDHAKSRDDAAALGEAVTFTQSNAHSLSFEPGAFDRVRIDRVLQHLTEPERAVGEMFRVLKPGGWALAYDNDWGGYAISSSDRALTARVESAWRGGLASPWIGRDLLRLFREAGFVDVEVHPSVSVVHRLDTADRLYNLTLTAQRLAEAGDVAHDMVDAWLADLREQSEAGHFQCSLTAFMAVGRKPGPR